MATYTFSQLITAQTVSDLFDALIAKLQADDFPTTDWLEGGPERTFLEMYAQVFYDNFSATQVSVAEGGLVDFATGNWLSLLAEQAYSLLRDVATATVGNCTFTDGAATGPHNISAGQFWVESSSGYKFTNTSAFVIPGGGSISAAVQAEAVGSAYNVAGSSITTLLTPIPGVTVNNPNPTASTPVLDGTSSGTVTASAGNVGSYRILISLAGQVGVAQYDISNDGGVTWYAINQVTAAPTAPDAQNVVLTFVNGAGVPSFILNDTFDFVIPGTWITTQGTDDETDATLVTRCKARWPALGDVPTADVYVLWALDASTQVTRAIATTNPATAATVNVTIAGPAGALTAAVVGIVQDYIDVRAPSTDLPVVASASATAVTLAGATVTVEAAYLTTAQAAAQAAVEAYVASIPIAGTIYYSQFIEDIMSPAGVVAVNGLTLNGGAVDVALGATNVATFSQTLSTALTWTVI